jgi:hypothetical protein
MYDRTFSQNPFESPSPSDEGLRSAILNCICPKCSGGLSLAAEQLRCQSQCGPDWRRVWISIRGSDGLQSMQRLKQRV